MFMYLPRAIGESRCAGSVPDLPLPGGASHHRISEHESKDRSVWNTTLGCDALGPESVPKRKPR